ncbi:MAG: MBG domain-containing protein, partial [Terriglobales bacterium]
IQNGRITINKAPLSVVANNVSRPFGSPNPTLTGTITGVKNGENITASFTTTAVQTSNVGTFAITAAAVFSPAALSANYITTLTNGTLTITAVPLTIAANNQTVVLNGTLANSATYSGFVLGQTPANLAGTLNCSSNGSTIGTHTITCSGQSSTNYSITFVPATETVTYAPVGTCAAGPGHQILAPIAVNGTTVFTRATTATIPIQFRVCDARGTAVSSAVVSSFTLLQRITGGVTTTLNQPQSTAFAFQGGAQDWLLNLSTSTPTNLAAGSTYVYQIGLNDGTSITFQFSMQ